MNKRKGRQKISEETKVQEFMAVEVKRMLAIHTMRQAGVSHFPETALIRKLGMGGFMSRIRPGWWETTEKFERLLGEYQVRMEIMVQEYQPGQTCLIA